MSKFALNTLIGLSLAILNFSSCKFGDASRGKALKQGLRVGERTQDPTKAQVLIHISNNPVNTSTFLAEKNAILKSYDEAAALLTDRKEIIENAKSLYEKDWDAHTTALATDIADIKIGICHANTGLSSGVVIINNSSIINKNFQYCPINEVDQRVPVAIAQPVLDIYERIKSNKLYESSPLSHPEIFQASLEMVGKLFPPEKHEYSLVIKAHGNSELAVTSKVAFESRLVTGKFIAKYFQSRPARRAIAILDKGGFDKGGFDKGGFDKGGFDKGGFDKGGFDKGGFDKGGFDKGGFDKGGFDKGGFDKGGFDKGGFDKGGFDKGGFDKGGLSSPDVDIAAIEKVGLEGPTAIETLNIRAAGISKEQLLQIILNPNHKMFFNVVFLESCNSDIGALAQDLADTPRPNIGYLYTSDKDGLGYNTLDYESARTSKLGSLRSWLVEELNKAAAKQN